MNRKILIIDDSDNIRQSVRRALAPDGYHLIEAVDGVDGLEKLRNTEDLALALCDVNMPRMTGIELLNEYARSGSKIPILMLTTEGQPSLIRKARECGAKGWIVKPFKTDLLLGAVRKILSATAVAA